VSLGDRIGALTTRALRSALVRYVRAQPRRDEISGAEKRVFMMLMTAYGMDGTIRTTLNLAKYLDSRGYEVVILSVARTTDEPFFELPRGVRVEVLDDARPERLPSRLHPLRRALRNRESLFMHPDDIGFGRFNLWADWRLVKALRRRAGFLITTRPGLNLIATFLAPPGLVLIGQEHMHLREHAEELQESMRSEYRKLTTLSVLTRRDRRRYAEHLEKPPRLVWIPNAVTDMGGVRADLSAKTVITAGRLVRQKGYDRLIKAWAQVAPEHPDWRLRIHGEGPRKAWLETLIHRFGLEGVATLAGPTEDLGAEMAKASIFALSSRWEGLPLALLEAMAVGMAVVSIDCPTGPADVIDDHRNGLLVRPRTPTALAAGLREMIEDEELRRRCSAAAVETAGKYSMSVIGPRWEETLQKAWARGRSKAAPGGDAVRLKTASAPARNSGS
jgi:glycosyltransferase involved in cell wall biosynthesis